MRHKTTWIIVAAIAANLLLAGVLIVPPVWTERNAAYAYQLLCAEYEVELVDPLDVCRGAHEWMLAQRGLFWRNRSADYEAYLGRVRHLEEKYRAAIPVTLYSDCGLYAEKKADEITGWREDAERSPERP